MDSSNQGAAQPPLRRAQWGGSGCDRLLLVAGRWQGQRRSGLAATNRVRGWVSRRRHGWAIASTNAWRWLRQRRTGWHAGACPAVHRWLPLERARQPVALAELAGALKGPAGTGLLPRLPLLLWLWLLRRGPPLRLLRLRWQLGRGPKATRRRWRRPSACQWDDGALVACPHGCRRCRLASRNLHLLARWRPDACWLPWCCWWLPCRPRHQLLHGPRRRLLRLGLQACQLHRRRRPMRLVVQRWLVIWLRLQWNVARQDWQLHPSRWRHQRPCTRAGSLAALGLWRPAVQRLLRSRQQRRRLRLPLLLLLLRSAFAPLRAGPCCGSCCAALSGIRWAGLQQRAALGLLIELLDHLLPAVGEVLAQLALGQPAGWSAEWDGRGEGSQAGTWCPHACDTCHTPSSCLQAAGKVEQQIGPTSAVAHQAPSSSGWPSNSTCMSAVVGCFV